LERSIDVGPEPKILRVWTTDFVFLLRGIFYRQTGNLHDAGLNGIHQTKVTDKPRERLAFGEPTALDVERCCGQVDAERNAPLILAHAVVDPVQPSQPDASFVALRYSVTAV
jgi:hypothetical protein